MLLLNKIQKYSTALIEHSAKLLRLFWWGLMPAPAGYDAYLKKVSLIYFGSEARLSKHETYVHLPASLRKPSMLFLNFFPLPWKLEQKWYGRSIIEAHHQARVHLVRHMIPHGKRILDLGGGDAVQSCGALLAMGYAKEPENLYIIDLPPQDRIHDPTTLGPNQAIF
ncbi:MAG: hypothetical protein HRU09_15475 [Oligoflexales bacterium]|nr:hypothetical protein [Oligoflexales bacterium]